MTEEWRAVAGREGSYEVSNQGRVRSLDRMVKHAHGRMRLSRGKILSPAVGGSGYLFIHFCADGVHKNSMVHRLVAAAFVPNPYGHPVVNHLDFNRLNNVATNLAWCTTKGNVAHAIRAGRHVRGEQHSSAILTDNEVRQIWDALQAGELGRHIGRRMGINFKNISAIKQRKCWKHLAPPETDALRETLAINGYRKGEEHPRAKLTEDDVRTIRIMLHAGATMTSVGQYFHVARATVSSIKRGKNWSHVQ